jgi:hypothetical protein
MTREIIIIFGDGSDLMAVDMLQPSHKTISVPDKIQLVTEEDFERWHELEHARNPDGKGSNPRMVKISKRYLDIMKWITGVIGGGLLFWGVSIVNEGPLDHWKTVTLVLSILCGLLLIAIALVLQCHE